MYGDAAECSPLSTSKPGSRPLSSVELRLVSSRVPLESESLSSSSRVSRCTCQFEKYAVTTTPIAPNAIRPKFAMFCETALYCLGAFVLARFLYNFARWLLSYNPTELLKDRFTPGEYAIVTGCTDGIGLEIVHYLRGLGYRLILVGRSADKLRDIACDADDLILWDCSESITTASVLRRGINGNIRVGVLVNNVGVCHSNAAISDCGDGETVSNSDVDSTISVNVRSVVDLTRRLLSSDDLLFEGYRVNTSPSCAIINVSSASSLYPCPYMSIYAASKAFLTHWSNSLRVELSISHPDMRVVTLTPYYVATKLSGLAATMTIPTAREYVQSSMCLLHKSNSCGNLIHDMMAKFLSLLPQHVREGYLATVNAPR